MFNADSGLFFGGAILPKQTQFKLEEVLVHFDELEDPRSSINRHHPHPPRHHWLSTRQSLLSRESAKHTSRGHPSLDRFCARRLRRAQFAARQYCVHAIDRSVDRLCCSGKMRTGGYLCRSCHRAFKVKSHFIDLGCAVIGPIAALGGVIVATVILSTK